MKRGFAALVLFLTMGATAILADTVGDDTTEVRDMAVVADSGTGPEEEDSGEGEPADTQKSWLAEVWDSVVVKVAVLIVMAFLGWFYRNVIRQGAHAVMNLVKGVLRLKSFEKRYLECLGRKYRHLELFGLKTRTPVSIELRKVYVPLKAVKPGDKRWKYTGDIESEPSPMPDPLDQRRLHKDEREERSKDIKVDIASLLRREKLLMILGGPGCGKTTFVGLLALAFATNNQRDWLGVFERKIPICIPCRDLNPAELPNATEFGECCLPDLLKEDDPGDYFKSHLDKGDCLILIDGLDEVPTVENRRKIVKWIHGLVTVYGNNQFVVTSRIMGYEQAPIEAGFAHYYVSDFDRNDVADFTKKWYETIETTLKDDSDQTRAEAARSADKLIETIETNDRLKRLASNPLLLSIIATVHRYAGRLPDNRARLYADCVDLLLGGKDEALGVELKLRAEQKLEVLKPIAHYLACREKRNIPLKDLKHEIGRYLPDVAGNSVTVDDFIIEVKNRSGLLVESGQDVFAFSHLTFQEYLAALYIKDQPKAVDLLISRKDNPRWREIILLYCSMTDATPFVERLLECREDVLLSNLCLAGFCLGDALRVSPELRCRVCDKLYYYWWDVPIHELRSALLTALAASKDEMTVGRLAERLNDESSDVRQRAAEALGEIGSEKGIEPLIERFNNEDINVHWSAAFALGRIGSEKATKPLIERLNDEDRSVRGSAAFALGQIGNEKAIEPLIERLNDEDRHIRGCAAEALGWIGSEKAIEPLIGRFNDEFSFIRRSAAFALGQIGSEKGFDPLIERLHDEDRHVRGCAAEALGWIGSEKGIEPLIELLNKEVSNVRGRAAFALGRIGSTKAVEPLLERLNDEDSDVRGNAAEALGRIGSKKAIEPLLERLNDEDSDVRWRAALALGQMGSEKAVKPLIERLKDESSSDRWQAALALGQIGSEKAIEPLIERFNDKDSYDRRSAAEALGKLMDQSTAETLLPKIDQKSKYGDYLYFAALFPYLEKYKLYIDELSPEVIERNKFWKENLKTDPIC